MKTLVVLLLLGMCWRTAFSEATPGDQCTSLKPTDAKLSLKVYKNITGHWVTRVKFDHGPAANQVFNDQFDLWDVDIRQSTVPCENGDAVTIEAILSSPPRRAGPGYELFPGVGYYKLHTSVLNWEQARAKCVEEGGHLAVINSEAESSVLQQLFSQYPQVAGSSNQYYAYIGFHDRYTEGQYVTIFGTPLESTGFTRWSGKGQPDNAGGGPESPGEDCGTVHRNGGLNDITCSHKLAFFCEQELWG